MGIGAMRLMLLGRLLVMNRVMVKGLLRLAEDYKTTQSYTNPYDIIECVDFLLERGLLSEEDEELLQQWASDCYEM